MGKLNVKNGTPVGSEHKCRGCVHGQFTVGYRDSDYLVICTNVNPNQVVAFPVYECTEFWDRHRPDWEQMEKLALDFSEGHRKPVPGFRGNGFARVAAVVDDEEEEAASIAR